jgi:hypothetical protein
MTELFIHALWDWRSAIASPYGPENPVTRHVLLTIALHMSPAGDSAFPTVERLMRETGLGKRSVIAHTAIAQKTGWLAKRERHGKSGKGWRRIEYLPLVPSGIEEKTKSWREQERRAWKSSEEGGALHAPRQGGAPRAPRNPVDNSADGGARSAHGGARGDHIVVHHVHPKVSVVRVQVNKAAAGSRSESKPVDKSAAAAAGRKLLYPPKLSGAQQEAMRPYLETLTPRTAQNLLDELEGIMREQSIRDPMAMFASLTRQLEDGSFMPSHAHQIQVEREGASR